MRTRAVFAGTGDVTDIGQQEGTGYAVNFPLKDGVTDEQYSERIFKPIIRSVRDVQRSLYIRITRTDLQPPRELSTLWCGC
jgi:acetoin utilization deacetylase AcuC-like enzyme